MRSIQSTIAEKFLSRASRPRLSLLLYDAKSLLELNLKRAKPPFRLSKSLMRRYKLQVSTMFNISCYTYPRNISNKTIIIYLHGGAYMNQPMPFHWSFLAKVHRHFPCEIIVPIYPKAPFHHVQESINKLLRIYQRVLKHHDAQDIVLMGDSSGGGFALALTMFLRERGIAQPRAQILLSPWLDAAMKNPEMKEIEKNDPMLDISSLALIGRAYAGRTSINNYLISPINGSFHDLAPITLFVGTREIFLPDCRLLRILLMNENIAMNYCEYEGMNHVFPLYPIPEASRAMTQIIAVLEGKSLVEN